MFSTIDRLRKRLPGGVEFHYIGTSDPHRFSEFAAIEDITVRHGFKDAAGMAATLASVHAGILTSEFEGMPRFVLETLGVGRPVAAIHLPQLEPVIHEGVSGFLVALEQRVGLRSSRPVASRFPVFIGQARMERIADENTAAQFDTRSGLERRDSTPSGTARKAGGRSASF